MSRSGGGGCRSRNKKKISEMYQERQAAENLLIKQMRDNIKSVEEKIGDIKETNQFIIPRLLQYVSVDLQHERVFGDKEIDVYKAENVTTLKNVKNEIRFINLSGYRREITTRYRRGYRSRAFAL